MREQLHVVVYNILLYVWTCSYIQYCMFEHALTTTVFYSSWSGDSPTEKREGRAIRRHTETWQLWCDPKRYQKCFLSDGEYKRAIPANMHWQSFPVQYKEVGLILHNGSAIQTSESGTGKLKHSDVIQKPLNSGAIREHFRQISCLMTETRGRFLQVCVANHFQFNTKRMALHSTMRGLSELRQSYDLIPPDSPFSTDGHGPVDQVSTNIQ